MKNVTAAKFELAFTRCRHILKTMKNVTAAKFELAFTRCRNNFENGRKLDGKDSLQGFDAKEVCLHSKNLSVSFQEQLKMPCFRHFQAFRRCSFQNVPIRVPFSKSTVFKICRQKMCRFRVNRRSIRRIFHRFQNVPASCERSLNFLTDFCIVDSKFKHDSSKESWTINSAKQDSRQPINIITNKPIEYFTNGHVNRQRRDKDLTDTRNAAWEKRERDLAENRSKQETILRERQEFQR